VATFSPFFYAGIIDRSPFSYFLKYNQVGHGRDTFDFVMVIFSRYLCAPPSRAVFTGTVLTAVTRWWGLTSSIFSYEWLRIEGWGEEVRWMNSKVQTNKANLIVFSRQSYGLQAKFQDVLRWLVPAPYIGRWVPESGRVWYKLYLCRFTI
jgi:hypothetical protein